MPWSLISIFCLVCVSEINVIVHSLLCEASCGYIAHAGHIRAFWSHLKNNVDTWKNLDPEKNLNLAPKVYIHWMRHKWLTQRFQIFGCEMFRSKLLTLSQLCDRTGEKEFTKQFQQLIPKRKKKFLQSWRSCPHYASKEKKGVFGTSYHLLQSKDLGDSSHLRRPSTNYQEAVYPQQCLAVYQSMSWMTCCPLFIYLFYCHFILTMW